MIALPSRQLALPCLFLSFLTFVPSSLLAAPRDDVYVRDVEFALEKLEEQCGHFFQIKGIDWKAVSTQFRQEAKKVRNLGQQLVLLTRLLARLEDGHATVRPLGRARQVRWPGPDRSRFTGPGMSWCKIGEKIYLKNVFGPATRRGLQPGLEILEVNRLPVKEWIARKTAEHADLISFSTDHQAFFYTTHWGLAAPPGTRMRLAIVDEKGKKRTRTLAYTKASHVPEGPAFLPAGLDSSDDDLRHGKTPSGYGYLHFRRCPGDLPEKTDAALGKLGSVPGMILDFRGNSGGGFDHDHLLGLFIPKGRQIAFKKRVPGAGQNPYGGPVVVIVDATVRSAGETAAGMFSEDGRAYMIGESPTAGMSSSKTTIELPSGLFALYVSVRSNKGRFNGGRGIEGLGVQPHEIVEFDPADLVRGVDTLIERAEALLKDYPQDRVPYDPADFGWKAP